MKLTLEQQCMLFVLYSQYNACWCSGDFRSQGNSRHGIDLHSWNIPSSAPQELIWHKCKRVFTFPSSLLMMWFQSAETLVGVKIDIQHPRNKNKKYPIEKLKLKILGPYMLNGFEEKWICHDMETVLHYWPFGRRIQESLVVPLTKGH